MGKIFFLEYEASPWRKKTNESGSHSSRTFSSFSSGISWSLSDNVRAASVVIGKIKMSLVSDPDEVSTVAPITKLNVASLEATKFETSSTKLSFCENRSRLIMTDDIAMVTFSMLTTLRSLRSSWPTLRVDKSLLTADISLKISVLKTYWDHFQQRNQFLVKHLKAS